MDFMSFLPNEAWWVFMLVANFSGVMIAYRLFGRIGLLSWIPISAILANIQVLKLVEIAGVTATLGNIVYATSFLATDILSENYGKRSAQAGVGLGFLSLISAAVIMNIALGFTPGDEDFAHESLVVIFGFLPRIALASLVAYAVSQFHDVWAYDFWKRKFPGSRYIWVRNNGSTMVSQLIDTLVFNTLAFWGAFPLEVFVEIGITTYALKWIVAALDTPLVYWASGLKRSGRIRELEGQWEQI